MISAADICRKLTSETCSRQACAAPLRGGQSHTRKVLLLEFLAPALDFRVVENLPDDAAEEALEVGILDVAQAADGFFFVALEERAAA